MSKYIKDQPILFKIHLRTSVFLSHSQKYPGGGPAGSEIRKSSRIVTVCESDAVADTKASG